MKKNELEHYEARIELLDIERNELADELDKALRENELRSEEHTSELQSH